MTRNVERGKLGTGSLAEWAFKPYLIAGLLILGVAAALIISLSVDPMFASEQVSISGVDRVRAAEAARLTGLAEYTLKQQAVRERSQLAESARLQGLADWYSVQEQARIRARSAETQRWQAMADYYLSKGK